MLIHVGYHKTGSTWLQRHAFTEARGFTTEMGVPRHRIVEDIVRPPAFDPIAPDRAAHYAGVAQQAEARGLTFVLSHERLSGYPPSDGYDRRLIADRLHAAFPEAKILIVIREQAALIRSMYSQYLTDGGNQSLKTFLSPHEPQLGRMPHFRLSMYTFDQMIGYYTELFGPGRVLVLPFEWLGRAPQTFVDAIAEFGGVPPVPLGEITRENSSRPVLMQGVGRVLNGLVSRNELTPGHIVAIPRFARRFGRLRPLFDRISLRSVEKRLDAGWRRRIAAHVGDHYAESNRRTAALTGLPLAELGYPVAESVDG